MPRRYATAHAPRGRRRFRYDAGSTPMPSLKSPTLRSYEPAGSATSGKPKHQPGESKTVNGVTYTFNSNHRWELASHDEPEQAHNQAAPEQTGNAAGHESAPEMSHEQRHQAASAALKDITPEVGGVIRALHASPEYQQQGDVTTTRLHPEQAQKTYGWMKANAGQHAGGGYVHDFGGGKLGFASGAGAFIMEPSGKTRYTTNTKFVTQGAGGVAAQPPASPSAPEAQDPERSIVRKEPAEHQEMPQESEEHRSASPLPNTPTAPPPAPARPQSPSPPSAEDHGAVKAQLDAATEAMQNALDSGADKDTLTAHDAKVADLLKREKAARPLAVSGTEANTMARLGAKPPKPGTARREAREQQVRDIEASVAPKSPKSKPLAQGDNPKPSERPTAKPAGLLANVGEQTPAEVGKPQPIPANPPPPPPPAPTKPVPAAKEAKPKFTPGVQARAKQWEMEPSQYDEMLTDLHREKSDAHQAALKAYEEARSWTGLSPADVRRHEEKGRDYGSNHPGISGARLDEIGQQIATNYPELGWGQEDAHDHDRRVWDMLKAGRPAAPKLKDSMDELDAHLDSQWESQQRNKAKGGSPRPETSPEESVPFAKWRDAWVVRYAAQRGLWDETKHPRGQPENAGEFSESAGLAKRRAVAKGTFVSAQRVGKGKEARIVMPDGSPVPEHIAKIASQIPPAWTDVAVSTDPDSEVLVRAKDAKGNSKTVYAPSYSGSQAEAKFHRVRSMLEDATAVNAQIAANRGQDAADAAWLMSVQATRPGSEEDTKGLAELYGQPLTADMIEVSQPKTGKGKPSISLKVGGKSVRIKDQGTAEQLLQRRDLGGDLADTTYWLKSHGATTLEGRHVVAAKDGVRLQFVGKEGVWHDHLIRDKGLAAMLLARKNKGDDKQLFGVNEAQLNKYIKTLDHGKYSAKDFRTKRANELAVQVIAKRAKPTNEKEYKVAVMEVAEAVSSVLGNRPTQALESYIDPSVFAHWKV